MNRTVLAALGLLWPVVASATPNDIPDGDFELGVVNGTDYWTTSSNQRPGAVVTYHGGSHVALLGAANYEVTVVEQVANLDYDMVQVELDYGITSSEGCGPHWDTAFVQVWTSVGTARVDLELCQDNAGTATLTLPLVGYAGDFLEILVVADTDGSVPSSFWIDNVTTN